MIKIGITGSNGFIGKNLIEKLSKIDDLEIRKFDRTKYTEDSIYLRQFLEGLDVLYHIAGVNRPQDNTEFTSGNKSFTDNITTILTILNQKTKIIYTSSTQAANPTNDYGTSKREAEKILENYANQTPNYVYIYRLPNVFGKWCRPFYNSVVATFSHQILREQAITIHDESVIINLVHINTIVEMFVSHIHKHDTKDIYCLYPQIKDINSITIGELAKKLKQFKNDRDNIVITDITSKFEKDLYSTFLSYMTEDGFSYPLTLKTDNRGSLVELLKSNNFGQIFFSTTKPGITRGNHYHNRKIEKFCVLSGEGKISFRAICNNHVFDYHVSGTQPEVVDIPVGYTHNITNIGKTDMLLVIWANEIFDPNDPDTIFEKV